MTASALAWWHKLHLAIPQVQSVQGDDDGRNDEDDYDDYPRSTERDDYHFSEDLCQS